MDEPNPLWDHGALRQRLLGEGRVGEVLAALEARAPWAAPVEDPDGTLLVAHARRLDGDYRRALALYRALRATPVAAARPLAWRLELELGSADAALRMGFAAAAGEHLEAARALAAGPLARCRIDLLDARQQLYHGEWGRSRALAAAAWELAAAGNARRLELEAEAVRDLALALEGDEPGSLTGLRRVGDELIDRGHLWLGTITLINLSEQLSTLRAFGEADRLLARCTALAARVRSRHVTTALLSSRGYRAVLAGQHELAERLAEQALAQLERFPHLHLTILTRLQLGRSLYRQGRGLQALQVARQLCAQAEMSGNDLHAGMAAQLEGICLLRLGQAGEALARLHRALELLQGGRAPRRWLVACLHAAAAHRELGQLDPARALFVAALQAGIGRAFLATYLEAREVLVPLLHHLGGAVPLSLGILGQLVVGLEHPGLVRRLLRRGVDGKRLFLSSLTVGDARAHRRTLARLARDPSRAVRSLTRDMLESWRGGTRYRVMLLGPLRVFQGRRLLSDQEWSRPQVKVLFLFLSMHAGSWVPAEVIMDALWTDPDPVRTRRTLATLVSYLRGALEPWRLPGEPPLFVRQRRGAYGFFPGDRFLTDTEEFIDLVRAGRTLCAGGSWEAAARTLQEALDLGAGDFCEEYPYEAWLEERREALRELFTRGALEGARALGELGRPSAAGVLLERGLARDPAHFELIEAHVTLLRRRGQVEAARQRCRQALALEEGLLEPPAVDWLRATLGGLDGGGRRRGGGASC